MKKRIQNLIKEESGYDMLEEGQEKPEALANYWGHFSLNKLF